MSEIRAMCEQIVVKTGSSTYYMIPKERVEEWNKYFEELQIWLGGSRHHLNRPEVPDFVVKIPTDEPWNDAVG